MTEQLVAANMLGLGRPDWVLTVGYPDPVLSPNSRAHWATVAKAKKAARTEAWAASNDAGLGRLKSGGLLIQPFAAPPRAGKRDRDNLSSSLKATYDGISDAAGIDDVGFVPFPPVWWEPVKGGLITMHVWTIGGTS